MKITLKLKLIGAMLLFAALYGCGGDGGGGSGPVTDSYVFPAGKATLAFSAMSTAQLSVPISGLDFSIELPQGMIVTTTGGGSGQIETASVTPGSSLTGTNLAFGSYSASTNTAHLSMATTSDTFRAGEFLRLSCTVAPNTSITLGSLKTANSPVLIRKAVGYDPVTKGTVILTGKIKVTIGAAN